MRKFFRQGIMLCLTACFLHENSYSQGIVISNIPATPDPKAILDVQSADRGILVPRVSLIDNDNPVTATKPLGLMLWNENDAFKGGKGFYFWNGTTWQGVIYYAGTGISLDGNNVIVALPNTINQAGIVPAPTNENKNATYTTDSAGNPVWKTENKTMYYINKF